MAEEPEDIDLDQIVWDPRYRRRVIERLNRVVHEPLPPREDAFRPASGQASRPH
jgi:hypothetical protein